MPTSSCTPRRSASPTTRPRPRCTRRPRRQEPSRPAPGSPGPRWPGPTRSTCAVVGQLSVGAASSSKRHTARSRSAPRSPPGTPSPCPDGFPRPLARHVQPASPCCPGRSSAPTSSRMFPLSGRPSRRTEPSRSHQDPPLQGGWDLQHHRPLRRGQPRGLGGPGRPGRADPDDHARPCAAGPARDPPPTAHAPPGSARRQHPSWPAAGSSPGWPPLPPAPWPRLACGCCTDVAIRPASAARSGLPD